MKRLLRMIDWLRSKLLRPTKITFDNNFLDKFAAAPREKRDAILRCVDSGRLEIFVNYEVLREAVGVAHTTRSEKLIGFARDILALSKGRFLNMRQPILEAELRGHTALVMDPDLAEQITAFLKQAAGGHIPSVAVETGLKALEEKRRGLEELGKYKWLVDDLPEGLAKGKKKEERDRRKSQLRTVTFDEVSEAYWNKYAPKQLAAYCAEWGVDDPEGVAARVMTSPRRYPHMRTWFAILALPAHVYRVKNEPRDAGAIYDFWQMLYLVDMDVYVTNEERLPGRYAQVFKGRRRVMSAEEFLDTKWC